MSEWVNPDYAGGGSDGTESKPWLTIDDALFTGDVLVNKGTTHIVTSQKSIASKTFRLSSYGTGDDPIIRPNVSNTYALQISDSVFTIEEIDFTSTLTPNGTTDCVLAIEMRGTVDGIIQDCNVEHTRFGIGIVVAGTVINSLIIRNNTISDTWDDNILLAEGSNVQIYENTLSSPGQETDTGSHQGDNIQVSVNSLDIDGLVIRNNTLNHPHATSAKQSIIITQGTRASANIEIYENEMNGPGKAHKATAANGMFLRCNANIHDNTIRGYKNAVYCQDEAYALEDNKVNDCEFGVVAVNGGKVTFNGGSVAGCEDNFSTLTAGSELTVNNVRSFVDTGKHINLDFGTPYSGAGNQYGSGQFEDDGTLYPNWQSWASAKDETGARSAGRILLSEI